MLPAAALYMSAPAAGTAVAAAAAAAGYCVRRIRCI
jgi:hypothetical protein